jgi:hypothetical protein
MKTKSLYLYSALAFFLGIAILSCQKDQSNSGPVLNATETIAAAKDAENVEAINDKVEQDVDNVADEMESNGFSALKSGSDWGCINVTVDHPDTVRFPKVVTLTFNCMDTINGEKLGRAGVIKITVDTIPVFKKMRWNLHLKRTVEFKDFTVATDSSVVTLNGIRTMSRKSVKTTTYGNNKNLRYDILDTITANYKFDILYNDTSRTITRDVAKSRNAIVHFVKSHNWHSTFFSDTVIFKGGVTGVLANGASYSRMITSPIIMTRCPYWPFNQIIPSGTIEQIIGSGSPSEIQYSANGCKTIITITHDGTTKTIERNYGRKFHRWW